MILQYFDKYYPDDGSLYKNLIKEVKIIKDLGITAIWLPPPTKTINTPLDRMGYGIFDRYDLGEFNQCGSIRTKYGTKNELLKAIKKCHKYNIKVYIDIVLNHLCALPSDGELETFKVITKNKYIKNISLPTYLKYQVRNNKYSSFKWHYYNFNIIGQSYIDWIYFNKNKSNTLYYINNLNDTGKYPDYLVGMNIYYNNEIIEETLKWIEWIIKETDCDGFRLDASKHLSIKLLQKIINKVKLLKRDFIFISEYVCGNLSDTLDHINILNKNIFVYDDLLYNQYINILNKKIIWRNIINNSLTHIYPQYSVTYVNNHDNQDTNFGLSEQFKKHLYAIILFKKDFGIPCIFNKDRLISKYIDLFLKFKKEYAYGEEINYFNNLVYGFTRLGLLPNSKTMAVIMTSSDQQAELKMFVKNKLSRYIDILDNNKIIISDNNGFGIFSCNSYDVSIWIEL